MGNQTDATTAYPAGQHVNKNDVIKLWDKKTIALLQSDANVYSTGGIVKTENGNLYQAAAKGAALAEIIGTGNDFYDLQKRTAETFNYYLSILENGDCTGIIDGRIYKKNTSVVLADSCTFDVGVANFEPATEKTLKHYGVAGDGTTDDTANVQRAVSNGGSIIDGEGLECIVTTIRPVSNTIWRDIKLKSRPETATVHSRPVIAMGGEGEVALDNVYLENVWIDGNRANLDSIDPNGGGNGEDGGMHCWRIGKNTTNVTLLNCKGINAGTAGIAITRASTIPATTVDYSIQNIRIINFDGTYARQHSIFADGFDGVYIDSADLRFAGLDLDVSAPVSSGKRGAQSSGVQFGRSLTLETYTGRQASYMKNFFGKDIDMRGSFRESSIACPNLVTEAVNIPIENINIDGEFGSGASSVKSFNGSANTHSGSNYGVDGLYLSGNFEDYFETNNIAKVTATDGFINSSLTQKATVNNGLDVSVTIPSNVDEIRIDTLSTATVVNDIGTGNLTFSISNFVKANGQMVAKVTTSLSGMTTGSGPVRFTVTLPDTIKATSANIHLATSAGEPVVSSVRVMSESQLRVHIVPISGVIFGNMDIVCQL